MNQSEKAARFAALHVKGAPLLLYNAWDAGSAQSILDAGAKAIATSSWAVAEAQGYRDGEAIPVGLVEQIVARIAGTIEVPVTVDFEGGYSDDDTVLAENVSRLLELGVVGVNFEDRVVQGVGLYAVDRQAHRIAAYARRGRQEGRQPLHQRTDRLVSGSARRSGKVCRRCSGPREGVRQRWCVRPLHSWFAG
jgi:2-methylisocitrate lyase-like PEP mutase family enzyme